MRGLTRRVGARTSRLRRQPPFAINERVDALPRFERYGGSDPLEKTMSVQRLVSVRAAIQRARRSSGGPVTTTA